MCAGLRHPFADRDEMSRTAAFRQLHQSGCVVLPNASAVGSIRYLQLLGFGAIATTSSDFAWSRARVDDIVCRGAVLGHLREIVAVTDLLVNRGLQRRRDCTAVSAGCRRATLAGGMARDR
ncbi:isocitrate lyase/phosphoenolpyruvate mutase family protein [Mycetohabitans rhizoxinica]|uniref:isocitrate lyase/phosphoenolpyruvate mutase family protein n=1 Tax=Mycetohabitans rhizoxinica TaxID=412963 RepID=UPI003BB1FC58